MFVSMTEKLDSPESNAPPVVTATTPAATAPRPGFISRVAGFVWWLLTGFGLLTYLARRGEGRNRYEEIVVYSVHRSFFLWAVILTGFISGSIVKHHPGTQSFLGWFYIWVLIYTFVSLLFDVSTPKLLLWAGIFVFVWLISKYMEDLKHILMLGHVFAYLSSLHPALNPGFAIVVSWLLLPAWIGSLFNTFTNGRKKFTPNEISEFYLGEGSELTDRSGLKFRTRYRDLFESVLGLGAGDIVAMDNQHHVVKSWENILFLAFIWNRMDAILHERSVMESPPPPPTAPPTTPSVPAS
jgi:hypothetical protein